MRRNLTTLALLIVAGLLFGYAYLGPTVQPAQAQSTVSRPFACGADDIGATLTRLTAYPAGACQSPEDGMAFYITTVVTQSTTTTGGQFIMRYGTGTNCGTGTATLFPFAAGSNVRLASPANTSPAGVILLNPPVKLPAGKDLCVIGVATNTTTIEVRGYIGVN